MLILDSMSPSIFSGLVAAIVSGTVSLIGYIVTAVIQNINAKKAADAQKEIAQMQKDEKLFYESQLRWTDEVRKLIAKFVDNCFKFNIYTYFTRIFLEKDDSNGYRLLFCTHT